jgi:hypothetical protein
MAVQLKSHLLKGYQVLVGTYDDIESELPDHYFDQIICNDVIE